MNWDTIKGQWKQFKGDARREWGEMTDDEWDQIGGDKDKMMGWLQEKYGYARQDAQVKMDEFFGRYDRSRVSDNR